MMTTRIVLAATIVLTLTIPAATWSPLDPDDLLRTGCPLGQAMTACMTSLQTKLCTGGPIAVPSHWKW